MQFILQMTNESDEELMLRIAEGSESAFRHLAARHDEWLRRLSARLLGSHADAEEVAQEALVRLWVNAPKWRPEASVRTWLYRVAVNLANDVHRRQRRRGPGGPLSLADGIPDPAPGPGLVLDRDETSRAVGAAIAGLPERQRNTLVLTYYEGLGNAEVAAILGTSVSGVEALLVRARRALREALAAYRSE